MLSESPRLLLIAIPEALSHGVEPTTRVLAWNSPAHTLVYSPGLAVHPFPNLNKVRQLRTMRRHRNANVPGFGGPEDRICCRKMLGAGGMTRGEVSLIGEPIEGTELFLKLIWASQLQVHDGTPVFVTESQHTTAVGANESRSNPVTP